MMKWKVGIASLAILGTTLGVTLAGGGDLKGGVAKIAALVQKGDKEGAKSAGAALAKKVESADELMELFKPRAKGGIGVGPKGAVTKDGIEQMILDLARDVATPARLAKEAAAIEEMGYNITALSEVTHGLKQSWTAKKTQKDWQKWSNEMAETGLKLAAAAKAKGGQELKTAAGKVRATCDGCHSIFR